MPEQCEHQYCEFDNRPEYCHVEAVDRDGAAGAVLLKLDELLYDSGNVSNDAYRYMVEGAGHTMDRNFSYLNGDLRSSWPLTDTSVAIRHSVDRRTKGESYAVEVGWSVKREDIDIHRYNVRYYLDVYEEGSVQAVVEAVDVVSGECETRSITTYDLEQLYGVLSTVADVHIAERKDQQIKAA